MTLFWTISAAMIVAALALIAPTLLRRHAAADDGSESLNVEIARERLDELARQRDDGEISDEEFGQARQDLELALAEDLQTSQAGSTPSKAGDGRLALLASAVLIPLITIPVYLEIGSPELIERTQTAVAGSPHGAGGQQLPPIGELAEQLRQRMEANPDNAEGWFLLGRTYMRLQDYAQAVEAFEKVVELLPDEAAGMLSLADALAMRNGGRVGIRAVALLERALEIDPDSVTALWLLGNAAADNGDQRQAVDYWKRAYPLLAGEPQMQAELAQRIRGAGGEPPVDATASLPPIMAATPPPVPAAPAAAPPADDDADGARIRVEVAVAPGLLDRLEPGDTLFVLARAESGPPMPLAVSRHRADELPLAVTLTDAMAMMPAMKLSAFPRVRVSARVSKSGQAASQPGDLAATDRIVDSATPPDSVQLLIDRVVE